jgi:hypothetical protein
MTRPSTFAERPLKVLTILARKGTHSYPAAAAEIQAIFSRQMPTLDRDTLIVDNDLPAGYDQSSADGRVIGGDNRHWEFSGFDRALAFIGRDIRKYDLVHMATAAFNTLHVEYLARFTEPLLRTALPYPACVGHIDCYNEMVSLLGYRSQHWIRSCFFFMRPSELLALGSLVSVPDAALFFTGSSDAPFRDGAPISPNYRRYITEWLTGKDIGQGVRWHRQLDLSSDNLIEFQEKTRAILNEHMLAIRLRALGGAVVDVTWLAAKLRQSEAINWRTSWRQQLTQANRDVVPAAVKTHS